MAWRGRPWLPVYLRATAVLLLAQGAISLVLDRAGAQLPPLIQAFFADPLHATVHVVWGLAMFAILATHRDGGPVLATLALVFGVFYIGLGVLGVLVHFPFGLHLGPGEHVFHFLVGTTGLILGARDVWRSQELADLGESAKRHRREL